MKTLIKLSLVVTVLLFVSNFLMAQEKTKIDVNKMTKPEKIYINKAKVVKPAGAQTCLPASRKVKIHSKAIMLDEKAQKEQSRHDGIKRALTTKPITKVPCKNYPDKNKKATIQKSKSGKLIKN